MCAVHWSVRAGNDACFRRASIEATLTCDVEKHVRSARLPRLRPCTPGAAGDVPQCGAPLGGSSG